jgi:ribonuclease T2
LPRSAPLIRQVAILAALFAALSGSTGGASSQSLEKRGVPGTFDFYVLALSWSPGFCAISNRDNSKQCSPDSDLGFVLHGLWPQYRRGYPANCDDRIQPTRQQIQAAVPPFPEEALVRHQWRKHGSCSGLDPSRYFELARKAFQRVVLPDEVKLNGKNGDIAPLAIERAFSEANPGLTPDRMSVQCRKGLFQEIRICLSKDLTRFETCPEVDRNACRSRSIAIIER